MFYIRMIFILLFFLSCSMVDPSRLTKGSIVYLTKQLT
jgi:hypothetical protein